MNLSKGQNSLNDKNERFSSAGFIMAAIGSSAGLGNIWKFPYITGQYGGAAFFMLFIFCLLLVGLPVLLAELALGRAGRGSAASAMVKVGGHPIWGKLSIMYVIIPFIILSFYSIVGGWTLHYAVQAFTGKLFSNNDFAGQFATFSSGYAPLAWLFIVFVISAAVVILGVSNGIERFNKILIPAKVILLLVLMVNALLLPGAGAGVSFFLNPDFSKLTLESALVALGHAFFSLSLGMGIMVTYGAYVDRRQSLGTAALAIGGGDLIYAFIAGMIIFPTTFSFGINPAQGPSLVFIALPAAFSAMPFGSFFGSLFFVLLASAAIGSMVSMLEVPVAYVIERFRWSRVRAVIVISILCLLMGVPSALSMGLVPELKVGGKSFFDFVDFTASNILLPLGGLMVVIFVGYFWKNAAEEANLKSIWFRIWLFSLRYVSPILMVLVFLYTSGIIKF
ncbi:sodium-dependent transporter [Paenibacillus sp. NPDC055715]